MMKKVGEHQKHCLGLIVQRHHMWKNREEERKQRLYTVKDCLEDLYYLWWKVSCYYPVIILPLYRQTTSWWNLCFHGNTVRLQAGWAMALHIYCHFFVYLVWTWSEVLYVTVFCLLFEALRVQRFSRMSEDWGILVNPQINEVGEAALINLVIFACPIKFPDNQCSGRTPASAFPPLRAACYGISCHAEQKSTILAGFHPCINDIMKILSEHVPHANSTSRPVPTAGTRRCSSW